MNKKLLKRLTPELLEYLAPGIDTSPYESGEPIICLEELNEASETMFSLSVPKKENIPSLGTAEKSVKKECPDIPFRKINWEGFRRMLDSMEREMALDEDELDPRTQAIINRWNAIQEEFGITIEELYVIVGYTQKLSRLQITKSGKIFLTDYGNREVKMNDLSKAVYFFYLRHPEGARLSELQDYEEEILELYMGVTGRDEPEEIRATVHNLLNPLGNDLNTAFSRIRRAFRNVVEENVASRYYIGGHAGDKYSVPINRDLVIWDH